MLSKQQARNMFSKKLRWPNSQLKINSTTSLPSLQFRLKRPQMCHEKTFLRSKGAQINRFNLTAFLAWKLREHFVCLQTCRTERIEMSMVLKRRSFRGGLKGAIALILACLLSSCGRVSTPSEATARKVYESLNKSQIEAGNLRVKNFKKTNGQTLDVLGHKIYKLEYEVQVERLNETVALEHFSPGEIAKSKAEETLDRKGVLTFEHTDRGWKAQDNNVY